MDIDFQKLEHIEKERVKNPHIHSVSLEKKASNRIKITERRAIVLTPLWNALYQLGQFFQMLIDSFIFIGGIGCSISVAVSLALEFFFDVPKLPTSHIGFLISFSIAIVIGVVCHFQAMSEEKKEGRTSTFTNTFYVSDTLLTSLQTDVNIASQKELFATINILLKNEYYADDMQTLLLSLSDINRLDEISKEEKEQHAQDIFALLSGVINLAKPEISPEELEKETEKVGKQHAEIQEKNCKQIESSALEKSKQQFLADSLVSASVSQVKGLA